ncbi:unnamed protein product [Sphagnum jensenii]|uniref:PLAT domain-containing protein n=1 Tax=Sphagnum jensenii TaxID=128206 RepID=A0ABP1BTU5_9BRYO
MTTSNDGVVDFVPVYWSMSWWFSSYSMSRWRFVILIVGMMAVASSDYCGTGVLQPRFVAAVRVVDQLVGIGSSHHHDFQMTTTTTASSSNDNNSAPWVSSPITPSSPHSPPPPTVAKEVPPPPSAHEPPPQSSPPMIAQREPPPSSPPHHAPPPPHHPSPPPPHHAPPPLPVVRAHEPPPPPHSIDPRVPSVPVNVTHEPPPSAANYSSPPPKVQSYPLASPPRSRASTVVSSSKLHELHDPKPTSSSSSSSKCQDPFPSGVGAPAPSPGGSFQQLAPGPSPFFAPSYQPVPAPTSGAGPYTNIPPPYTPSTPSNSTTVAHTTMVSHSLSLQSQQYNQCTYTIITTTGNIEGAGTTADVNVEFFDRLGSSVLFVGLKSQNRNFQKGSTDTFTLIGDCVQQICRMHISHDDAGIDPSWFIDTVTVSLMYQTHVFNVYEWLAKNEPPYTISREISSCGP